MRATKPRRSRTAASPAGAARPCPALLSFTRCRTLQRLLDSGVVPVRRAKGGSRTRVICALSPAGTSEACYCGSAWRRELYPEAAWRVREDADARAEKANAEPRPGHDESVREIGHRAAAIRACWPAGGPSGLLRHYMALNGEMAEAALAKLMAYEEQKRAAGGTNS